MEIGLALDRNLGLSYDDHRVLAREAAELGYTSLWMNAGNRLGALAFEHRYGKVYNRNLPVWYTRELDSRVPIVPSPDHIHLFVAGGDAGRFSAFIPGWGHMNTPVMQPVFADAALPEGPDCACGLCAI